MAQIVVENLSKTYEIAGAAVQATNELTSRKFPGVNALSDEADAYRHTLASHIASRMIGDRRAKALGDAHEIEGLRATWWGWAELGGRTRGRPLQ